jgi:uncharacterized membrane protein
MKIKRNNAAKKIAVISLLLTLFVFHQNVYAETEAIEDFNVNIAIQKNGVLFVTENIVYNFGSNQRHGIFRDIPLTAVEGPRLHINVSGVSNEFGQPYQYTTSIANNTLRIKIGEPNVFVSGVKTYVISYQVYNAIRNFNDHNELYWNATGNQWPVSIQKAGVSVILPDSFVPNVRMDCFTGLQGSVWKNCVFNQGGSNITYSTTKPLNAKEGLTIVLGIPLGYISNEAVPSQKNYPATNSSNNLNFLVSFFFLGLFIVVLAIVFVLLKPKALPRELRDRPIIAEYEPPDNLLPIEIGALLDHRVDLADISSVIISLAVRGYLKIRFIVEEIAFWPDKKDFEFIKLKDGADLTHPADKIIFDFLFSGRDRVKISDLEKQKDFFQLDFKKIQKATESYLYEKGYFDQAAKDRAEKIRNYLPPTATILFIVFFLSFQILPAGLAIALLPLILIVITILFLMKAKLNYKLTPQGISALGKILGFKEFLEVTEKDRLKFLNAPELQPEIFEKFLPYAMVLGVEKSWSKKFEGIYSQNPNWYEDSTITRFNSDTLSRKLNLFNNYFILNVTSRRRTSSSSGFGGRGFSGGGSGGGGGGSW